MGNIAKEWEMECPHCGSDNKIDIAATVLVRLVVDGTDINAPDDGDHVWDDDSRARCANCGHAGKVKDFQDVVRQPEYTVMFRQTVEQTAELCVRAAHAHGARMKAEHLVSNEHVNLVWGEGDDGTAPEIYCIKDASGETVFQA